MGNIDNLTVVSTEGASQLTKTVGQNVLEGTNLLNTIVPGFDLGAMLNKFMGSAATNPTKGSAAPLALTVTPEKTEDFIEVA